MNWYKMYDLKLKVSVQLSSLWLLRPHLCKGHIISKIHGLDQTPYTRRKYGTISTRKVQEQPTFAKIGILQSLAQIKCQITGKSKLSFIGYNEKWTLNRSLFNKFLLVQEPLPQKEWNMWLCIKERIRAACDDLDTFLINFLMTGGRFRNPEYLMFLSSVFAIKLLNRHDMMRIIDR